MGNLFQGSPLPDITQTTSTKSTAPDYYTNYLKDLGTAGQTALTKTANTGIAGMDPLQTKGYGALETAADSYKAMLTDAEATARAAGEGISPDRIKALLNPYQTNVVDEMARLQQQNIQRNVLPGLRAGFVGQGALGSQRYAGALGQAMTDMQSNLTGQQYGALSAGYNKALEAALNELQTQNQAAQTQGMLASKGQELGLTGAGALTKAGGEKQAFEQSKLDYPLRTATTVSNLMRGFQVPMDQTQTFVGPKDRGLYQQSPLDKALSLASLVGAGASGTAGRKLGDAWSKIINAIKSGQGTGTGTGTGVVSEPPGDSDFGETDWTKWESIFDYDIGIGTGTGTD
jgi:hypothetical protein